MDSFKEGSREELEVKEENFEGREVESIKEIKDVEKIIGESGKDEEREIGREEGVEKGDDILVDFDMDLEYVFQEDLVFEESWEVVYKYEVEKGRESEIKELRRKSDFKLRED